MNPLEDVESQIIQIELRISHFANVTQNEMQQNSIWIKEI